MGGLSPTMKSDMAVLYVPGVRGWWQFLRLRDCVLDGDGVQWRTILRRLRPSARLRQAEQERAYWVGEVLVNAAGGCQDFRHGDHP